MKVHKITINLAPQFGDTFTEYHARRTLRNRIIARVAKWILSLIDEKGKQEVTYKIETGVK